MIEQLYSMDWICYFHSNNMWSLQTSSMVGYCFTNNPVHSCWFDVAIFSNSQFTFNCNKDTSLMHSVVLWWEGYRHRYLIKTLIAWEWLEKLYHHLFGADHSLPQMTVISRLLSGCEWTTCVSHRGGLKVWTAIKATIHHIKNDVQLKLWQKYVVNMIY